MNIPGKYQSQPIHILLNPTYDQPITLSWDSSDSSHKSYEYPMNIQQCSLGKNRRAGLVYYLSSLPVANGGNKPSINQPTKGKKDITIICRSITINYFIYPPAIIYPTYGLTLRGESVNLPFITIHLNTYVYIHYKYIYIYIHTLCIYIYILCINYPYIYIYRQIYSIYMYILSLVDQPHL